MRNDARPIGAGTGHRSPIEDHRSSAIEGQPSRAARRSDVINRPRKDRAARQDDADSTMPADDATLNVKI